MVDAVALVTLEHLSVLFRSPFGQESLMSLFILVQRPVVITVGFWILSIDNVNVVDMVSSSSVSDFLSFQQFGIFLIYIYY